MGGACSTHEEEEKYVKYFGPKKKRRKNTNIEDDTVLVGRTTCVLKGAIRNLRNAAMEMTLNNQFANHKIHGSNEGDN